MLHLTNGSIVQEGLGNRSESLGCLQAASQNLQGGFLSGSSNFLGVQSCQNNWPYQTYWYSYPVYVCSDKTAKSIEILKKLQAEKVIDVKSVPRFIELVEQISAIL